MQAFDEVKTDRNLMDGSIDIITVVTSPGFGLRDTMDSIIDLHIRKLNVNWIVVVGKTDKSIQATLDHAKKELGDHFIYRPQSGRGIYGAMNEALSLTRGEFFMLLNSGDYVLPNFINACSLLDQQKVHCFKSSWHDESGEVRDTKLARKSESYWLGRMPNHQSMIFPSAFRTKKYDEAFPIAADQDMKLGLYKSGLLEFHQELIVSSLVGGVSARKLRPHEIKERFIESRDIFRCHYPRIWAEILSLIYGANYLRRIKR